MDQGHRRSRESEELARACEIVARQPMPAFVRGFDIRFGEFDGDPAMWVTFKVDRGSPPEPPDRLLPELQAMKRAVHADLLEAFEDRWPYYRYDSRP